MLYCPDFTNLFYFWILQQMMFVLAHNKNIKEGTQ